jgi:hypothetical protein
MPSKALLLRNIANALASEGSVERSGQVMKNIATQLGYAGIQVTVDELTTALDAVAVSHPSCFGEMPPVSTHYGPWGLEYRFRPSDEYRQAVRACVDAVYGVTDTMDRTEHPTTLPDGSSVRIEKTRPHAFAVAYGHLRLRWAASNFNVPRAGVIRRWVGIA